MLLRPLVVSALNCFPPGGQSGSELVYQLPVGDYDLTVTWPDEWQSEPVRLRVTA